MTATQRDGPANTPPLPNFCPSHLLIAINMILTRKRGFHGGSDGKESACNAGDPGLIPGLGRSPGEGNGSPTQYSCLENPLDRGAWWATVHGVTDTTEGLAYILSRKKDPSGPVSVSTTPCPQSLSTSGFISNTYVSLRGHSYLGTLGPQDISFFV